MSQTSKPRRRYLVDHLLGPSAADSRNPAAMEEFSPERRPAR